MKQKKTWHYAWVILIVLCVVRSLSAAAINNTSGLFLKPVSDDLGVGVGQLSLYFSVSSIAVLFFMPIAGKFVSRFSATRLICVSILVQAGSFIALGFMNSVWAWYIFSIPMGFGSAILVNLLGPILINRWFYKNSGVALGILMASVGIFGAIIQPMVSNMIATQGWRFTYRSLGGIVLVIIFILAFFIKGQPADKGLLPYGVEKEGEGQHTRQGVKGVSLLQARKSTSFYMLIIFMVTITAFGAFASHIATYAYELDFTSTQTGLALSISMIGSTLGAILIGLISDKMGAFKTTMTIIGVAFIAIGCLVFAKNSFFVFVIGAFLMGLASMGIPVLSPLLARDFFGERDYSGIYANIMMGAPLATIFLLPSYGFVFDLTGSYFFVFILLTVLMVIGAVCMVIADKKRLPIED